MTRQLRLFSRPRQVTAEITQVTFQFRSLLKPDRSLNLKIVGALARAKELYPIDLHSFVFLSTHLHLQATFSDAERMSDFMRHFSQKVSKEVGLAHDWDDSVFPKRYHHVELSQEPEVELARLRYVTSNSCKESLVMSPLDWPGVSSAEALITGEPMKGEWVDRTAYHHARNRGEDVSEADFTEELELHLTPLPSQAHLSARDYRQLVLEMVREIEAETLQRHRENKTAPLGVEAILSRHPHYRPGEKPSSPRPWFHAIGREVREAMRTALIWIVAAYREASERYRAGEFDVEFPEGTFPPARPFANPWHEVPLVPG